MKDKNEDLRKWLTKECDRCEMYEGICYVLGEKFYDNCLNSEGKLCRYHYL